MGRALTLVGTLASTLICFCARADESLLPIVESGNWIALAHRASMTDPPDVCVALNVDTGVAFRSDGNSVQLRIINTNWSLPSNVKGTLQLSVSDWKKSFEITDNTESMVNAEIPDDIVADLFTQMDHASIMHILPGKAKMIDISLSGSTKVTNAFRTCAGIKGNAESPGSNPFN